MRYRLLVAAAVAALIAYVGISARVADRLSRPDRSALAGDPGEVGLDFEAVEFASAEDGLPMRGWWMPAATGDRAVIVVHGRGGTRTGGRSRPERPGSLLLQAQRLVPAGYGVLAFDLRGHGQSGGTRYSLGPWERRDVLGAIAHVRARGVAPGRIGLLCHSMGAATCLLTAPDAPAVGAIVSDSAYARLDDLLAAELPEASGLPSAFNPGILLLGRLLYGVDVARASPEEVVARIAPRPVLFVHSQSDALIPVEHARRLWRASGQPAEHLWTVPGPSHDQIFDALPEEYMTRVLDFLGAALGRG